MKPIFLSFRLLTFIAFVAFFAIGKQAILCTVCLLGKRAVALYQQQREPHSICLSDQMFGLYFNLAVQCYHFLVAIFTAYNYNKTVKSKINKPVLSSTDLCCKRRIRSLQAAETGFCFNGSLQSTWCLLWPWWQALLDIPQWSLKFYLI